jgi:hypothetical protein
MRLFAAASLFGVVGHSPPRKSALRQQVMQRGCMRMIWRGMRLEPYKSALE